MEEYDVLVLGSGAGLEFASIAGENNRTVGIVEKESFGGAQLDAGARSKRLLYHAEVLETIERADEFHIDASVDGFAFEEMVRDVDEELRGNAESLREGVEASPFHYLYEGEARFVDERTVEVVGGADDGTRIRADTVILATGSRPATPDVEGIESVDYLTSEEALRVETPPDRLVILGSGYISVELGHLFGTFGSDVTFVCREETLLPEVDEEVAETFTERYGERFTVHTATHPTGVSETDGTVTLEATSGRLDGPEVSASGDVLLVADGRVPNTAALDLDAAGIETDEHGYVETDEYLRTTADGVWAVGDVTGNYLLKHSASHEVAAVARNIYEDERRPVDYSAMPLAVFASPEVASVGAQEQYLEAGEYATYTEQYESVPRGRAMGAEGFVKAIIDTDRQVIGCHILGPRASELIQEVVTAMHAGEGTVRNVRRPVHVHPALSEVVQQAFSGQFRRTVTDFSRDD